MPDLTPPLTAITKQDLLPAGTLARRLPNQATTGQSFSRSLEQARLAGLPQRLAAPQLKTVDKGDTLIAMVREQAISLGLQPSSAQNFILAQRVASNNKLDNPDRIFPGQTIDMSSLQREFLALQSGALPSARASIASQLASTSAASRSATSGPIAGSPVVPSTAALSAAPGNQRSVHPVLEVTLNRAVNKGYIAPSEKAAVYDKIVRMGQNHRFSPDDFARMTLMESDGMNPRASNQRCHGIIQFCDGPARGASSVGFANNPRAILDMSVHQQLDLVDKYFDDVGLKKQGPAGLEDLYLSVLHPASRSQVINHAALNIPGTQARALYVGSDTSAAITRQSLRQGLLQNAAERLGQFLPVSLKSPAQKIVQYVPPVN